MGVPDHYRERVGNLMAAYVFDKLIAQGARAGQIPARTQQSRDWFRDKASNTRATPGRLISSSGNYAAKPEVGGMFLFGYDPKHKKTLPYYDRFPLVLPVEEAEGGFVGLNMHYLPLKQRAVLMDALYKTVSDERYNDKTRLRMNYSLLKGASRFKGFKPTFKRYLASHVKTRFIKIEPVEWDIALFLPLQRFEKASAARIHKDSLGAL
jgi:hypothetical protein